LNSHPADDAIRAALRQNDPAAVELIWDRCASDLLAFLQALLCSKHDAEDVLQTVFVRIVRQRQQLAKARCLDAYIHQIARNEASSFLRQRRRRHEAASNTEPWLLAADADGAGDNLTEELQAALSRLPQEQREIVVLKIYRSKTFREIAEMLGLPLNTVASRYRYGLEKLRAMLKDSVV